MQRKSYAFVPGVAVLLAAVLAGCTSGSDGDGGADDSKPGEPTATASTAEPGKYRTLPEPCSQPDRGTLDEMLPGIRKLPDAEQREKAYEGVATVTYDTDRRVGCRWKDDSARDGTHRLSLDFERVVSYDTAVSDDDRAASVFASKADAAHLPEPVASEASASASSEASDEPSADASDAKGGDASDSPGSPSSSASGSGSPSGTSADLQPRLLDDLGDEAFVDDVLAGPTTGRHRTVTVAFRTSNVLVTVRYEVQSATAAKVPDSKEMQDTARNLAGNLVGKFGD
ncbi:DUF3558 domain-containing protein [Streptomyces sp. NBC_00006]|uniref:DUF3558 domain-containing protein n=1 Tax=unclassified Streptomyces TaxID=2593676 RepID=UPI0022525761|nr:MULTISPECIES: DUF3558 domain-containing protein [unclassified Streptomyces]MCX4828612.1 DUF3558 domain-containing protein [Streptomyces sp. NBC_01016]MCX5532016.1 DUF3558 domain-containing protein [Streptomyces sp. NBC_00006]